MPVLPPGNADADMDKDMDMTRRLKMGLPISVLRSWIISHRPLIEDSLSAGKRCVQHIGEVTGGG